MVEKEQEKRGILIKANGKYEVGFDKSNIKPGIYVYNKLKGDIFLIIALVLVDCLINHSFFAQEIYFHLYANDKHSQKVTVIMPKIDVIQYFYNA